MDALLPPSVANSIFKRLLAEARTGRQLSQRVAAERCGRNQSWLAQLESARNPERLPKPNDLLTLLDIYERPDLVNEMVGLLHIARQYISQPHQPILLPDFEQLVALEIRASRICSWSHELVHGVLQTAQYAREVVTNSYVEHTHDSVNHLIHLRELRRGVYLREENPVIGEFWTCESALRRPVGSRQTHGDQLEQLALIADRPNVTFRVVPSQYAVHPGLGGSFDLIHDHDGRRTAYEETRTQAIYHAAPQQLHPYERTLFALENYALSPTDSVQLIKAIQMEVTRE